MAEVLEWLREQNRPISPRSYHEFVVRVLRLLPISQACDLGVDTQLLVAVRTRYNLPVDPKQKGAARSKPLPRHHALAKRRRIAPRKEPALIRERVEPSCRKDFLPATATPIQVRSPELVPASTSLGMRGTLDEPQGYQDWEIVNKMARKKVFAKDRMVMLNYQGAVIHCRTRHEYTQGELEDQFGLTSNEAESCFMTFTASERK